MLPPVLETVADEARGMILCTGTTGSGKSTTLAAMIDHVNATRNEHIITVEDPIEFLHRDKKSLVNQREIDVDTRGFAQALRAAMRQDPDVVLVGEMRDHETIETALHAAETGHLVLSTLPHGRRVGDHQPHHFGLSAAPSEADPYPARAGAQGDRLLAPGAARRRHGPGAGGGGDGRHALHPRLHREQREDQVHSPSRSPWAPLSTACRPSINLSSSSTRAA